MFCHNWNLNFKFYWWVFLAQNTAIWKDPLNPISIESFYDTFVTATESNNDIGDETFQKSRQNHQNQQKKFVFVNRRNKFISYYSFQIFSFIITSLSFLNLYIVGKFEVLFTILKNFKTKCFKYLTKNWVFLWSVFLLGPAQM